MCLHNRVSLTYSIGNIGFLVWKQKNLDGILGDKAISLHILPTTILFIGREGRGVFCISLNSKCQDLPKFQWGGGGGVFWTQILEQGVLANLVKKF